jgi:N-dimethylarginine dimethylaminohydrolase
MTAADNLAHGGEVGAEVVESLTAAECEAEGDYLVQDEDDAVAIGLDAEVLEVAIQRGQGG